MCKTVCVHKDEEVVSLALRVYMGERCPFVRPGRTGEVLGKDRTK